MYQKVEISHKTIIFSVFFLLLLWFLYFVKDLLLILFAALLLVAVLDPLVTKLSSFKIPRGVATFLSYILVLGSVGGVIALIAPPLIEQSANFANSLPSYIANLGIAPLVSAELSKEFLTRVGSIPEQILKFVLSVFSNVLSVLTVLVFAFYMLLTSDKFDENLKDYFGEAKTKNLAELLSKIKSKIGSWAGGQFLLMLAVGILNYIGFTLLGIPFALPLAILAGLFEIIPYLGPIFAAVPAVLIGFGVSSFAGFGVVIMATLVQQVENYILVPKIMGKSVGVSPMIILLSLAVGQKLAGVTGMIISIPFVITTQVILQSYFFKEDN